MRWPTPGFVKLIDLIPQSIFPYFSGGFAIKGDHIKYGDWSSLAATCKSEVMGGVSVVTFPQDDDPAE